MPAGRRHPAVARLRRLSTRRTARRDTGRFVVDGPVLLAEALATGFPVEEVFAEPTADADLLAAAADAGARVVDVADGVLAYATDTATPRGVAAVVPIPAATVDDAVHAAARGPLALVLVDVADPGNAGTLVRAAEAAGAAAVLFCGASADPFSPKCVRASAGAVFHVTVAGGGGAVAVLTALGGAGVRRAVTVVRGGTPYDQADLDPPLAVVLGSEAHGLPAPVAAMGDVAVTIPMAGRTESLNVAMAGTVLCMEALRRRRGERT